MFQVNTLTNLMILACTKVIKPISSKIGIVLVATNQLINYILVSDILYTTYMFDINVRQEETNNSHYTPKSKQT